MPAPNWEIIIKIGSFVMSIVASVITGVVKLKPAYERNRYRAELKADLDILKGLVDAKLDDKAVRGKISYNLQLLYPAKKAHEKRREERLGDIGMRIYGALMFGGLGYWTYALYRNHHGFTGWMILTGIFAVGGISLMISGYTAPPKTIKKGTVVPGEERELVEGLS